MGHENNEMEPLSDSEKLDYVLAKLNEVSTRLDRLERIYYTNSSRYPPLDQ